MQKQKKIKRSSDEIGEQIDRKTQERKAKFEHWIKILDEANAEADKAFQYAIVVKQDAIKDMGQRLQNDGVSKQRISTELIRGFCGRISPGYISHTCKEHGWTDPNKSRSAAEKAANEDSSLDELDFQTKEMMDQIIEFWLDADMKTIIGQAKHYEKGENWFRKIMESRKEQILNRWVQMGLPEINITMSHNRRLFDLLRFVNDVGYEQQKTAKRNEEMFGK